MSTQSPAAPSPARASALIHSFRQLGLRKLLGSGSPKPSPASGAGTGTPPVPFTLDSEDTDVVLGLTPVEEKGSRASPALRVSDGGEGSQGAAEEDGDEDDGGSRIDYCPLVMPPDKLEARRAYEVRVRKAFDRSEAGGGLGAHTDCPATSVVCAAVAHVELPVQVLVGSDPPGAASVN